MAFIKCFQALCSASKLALKTCSSDTMIGRIECSRHFGKSIALTCKVPNALSVDAEEVSKRLMEFFDDQKNWGENEVKVGRSWRKEELRIKSNTDLHKLWYVLLKEKNMLLTMEHESKEKMRLFPNPERLDKVKESMDNLEEVVRERNKAYYMLETGEDGERQGRVAINSLGLTYFRKMREYAIPQRRNVEWWKKLPVGYESCTAVDNFLRLYREKLYMAKKRARIRRFNHVQHLMRRFPHMDLEALRKQNPDVDLEKARVGSKAYGHHEFNS